MQGDGQGSDEELTEPLTPVTLPPVDEPLPAGPRPEEQPSERLQKKRVIGQGGMGLVHVARDPVLRREVALKVMRRGGSSNWHKRFITEAQVTAQLDHPHIVPIYDASLDDTEMSYSMKLVSGETLTKLLKRSFKARRSGAAVPNELTLDTLLDHFAKLCDALAYAHEKGVVHRDLKPDNIMVGAHGEVYLMDWGLARVSGAADVLDLPTAGAMTLPGHAIGTAAYMAPEQALGQPMGPACDQYALGLILFEMISGVTARARNDDVNEGLQLAAEGTIATLRPLGAEKLRRELAAIVDRATHTKPNHRYASVGELAEDLRRYRANLPVRAAPDHIIQWAQRWLSNHREATLRLMLLMVLALVMAAGALGVVVIGSASVYASMAATREERLTQLVGEAGSRAAQLDRALGLIQSQVEATAGASAMLLEHGIPQEGRVLLAPSVFDNEAARPADTAHSTAYNRPISTEWPDLVIAPNGDREQAIAEARKLISARHAMRRAHLLTRMELGGLTEAQAERAWRDEQGPIRWAIVATPAGLYLELPGAAWNVTGFDPRVRPWYTLATEPKPRWSEPYQEASSGTLLVACSMQIPSGDGGVYGVTSLSVSFTYLIGRYLELDHHAVEETFLVDGRGRVIVRSSQALGAQRPTALDESSEMLPFPEPALRGKLSDQSGMLYADDGQTLYLHHPLSNGWWYVAQVDAAEAVAN